MAVMVLWPAWERAQVPQQLADLLEAEGRYLLLILRGYLDPATLDPALARHCRLKTRLARSNAEASVQRSLSEPARFRTNARVALGVLASDVRLFSVTLALEAVFWHTRPTHPLASLRPLIDGLQTAAQSLSRALRLETQVWRWPDLRTRHRALVKWLETSGPSDGQDRARLTFVVAEAERLMESLCAIRQLLAEDRERSGEPASEHAGEPLTAP